MTESTRTGAVTAAQGAHEGGPAGAAPRHPRRRARWLAAAWAGALVVALGTPEQLVASASVGAATGGSSYRELDDAVAVRARKKRKKRVARRSARGRNARASADDTRDASLPREIKKEQRLAPKKEVELDEQLGKTKDLKPTDVGGKGPTLNAADLEKRDAESLLDSKLDEEIQLTQQLLDIESDCAEASPARFRLADLYWEKSKRAFFKANDFKTSARDRDRYNSQMKGLQEQSIEAYQTVVDECGDYKELPKVLYYLGKALMEVDRAKEGATYFKRVIQEFPSSEWVPHSWFMIGEYYFNVANDALAALKAYSKATEYPKSSMYGYAVYKQGWCYINTGDWPQALEKFKKVVGIAEDDGQELEQRARLALRKEALRDFVRAYSNIGEPRAALRTFYALGGKDSVQTMMEQLGNWYINRDAHPDTVVVFRDLIKSYPRSTRLPVWEGRIVDATSRMGDKRQTVAEAKRLTEYFADLRARVSRGELSAEEKKGIDKDVREAEDIAENTLRRLAFEYYKDATKLKGQAAQRTLVLAQELHRHYLEVFPEPRKDSEVNYVFYVRFQYADILYKVEEFEQAAKNYEAVVEMNPHPTNSKDKSIVLTAAEEAVRSYDELVQDLDRKSPPEISGTEPKPIPPIKQKLIDACQRYIHYVGSEGEKIVEIRYKMARIYYTYNHFDKAAPAFDDIVANHPQNEVACYAANLVLDIYNGKKDYRSLKEASRSYLDNSKLACGDEDKKRFAKIEESSTFLLVKGEYEEKKRYVAAGNAYMDFYKAFPNSEYAGDAVYNAAVNYDLGNKLDKANEIRRFLVDKMVVCKPGQKEGCAPEDLIKETLYNIAQSSERIVDFDNAARYLDQFAARFKDDKRSKDAIFNAALYRATLGDYAGGKAGREKFIKLYPADPDIHEVAFAICESLEEEARSLEAQRKSGNAALAKWQEAHDCYFAYTRNSAYARADTDMLCQAQVRRMEIMRTKTNYQKGVEEMKTYLLRNWPTWKKVGIEKLPRCSRGIAELQLRDLDARFKRYGDLGIAELNPSAAGKKRFDASVKAKVTERDAIIEEYKKVVEIGVAEPALTALYYIGEAYRSSIDALLKAPIPDKIEGMKLSADDKEMLRGNLRQMAAPIEAMAVDAYTVCVQKANELGVYNKWSIRALDRLHKLRPDAYPLVVERTEPMDFVGQVRLQQNGIVIADGESFKAIDLPLKAAPAAAPARQAPVPAKSAPVPAAARAAPRPPAAAGVARKGGQQ